MKISYWTRSKPVCNAVHFFLSKWSVKFKPVIEPHVICQWPMLYNTVRTRGGEYTGPDARSCSVPNQQKIILKRLHYHLWSCRGPARPDPIKHMIYHHQNTTWDPTTIINTEIIELTYTWKTGWIESILRTQICSIWDLSKLSLED